MNSDADVNTTEISVPKITSLAGSATTSNPTRSTKEYVRTLFNELLPAVRAGVSGIPQSVTDEELIAAINYCNSIIISPLALKVIRTDWYDDIPSWVASQKGNNTEVLLGKIFLVQSFKHHKSTGQTFSTSIRAIEKCLCNILKYSHSANAHFVHKAMNRTLLLSHFLEYMKGASTQAELRDWLSRFVCAPDKCVKAIEDAEQIKWSNTDIPLENSKRNLRLWYDIYVDTIGRVGHE